MSFFKDCHTIDQLKDSYRYWCKKLHPDKGGDKVEFQVMQDEYQNKKWSLSVMERVNTLPDYFHKNGNYQYFRRPVKYVGVIYNHYYKFIQDFGADILIDVNNIRLIFTIHTAING